MSSRPHGASLLGRDALVARLRHLEAHAAQDARDAPALIVFKEGGAEPDDGPQRADQSVGDRHLAAGAPLLVPPQQVAGLDLLDLLVAIVADDPAQQPVIGAARAETQIMIAGIGILLIALDQLS